MTRKITTQEAKALFGKRAGVLIDDYTALHWGNEPKVILEIEGLPDSTQLGFLLGFMGTDWNSQNVQITYPKDSHLAVERSPTGDHLHLSVPDAFKRTSRKLVRSSTFPILYLAAIAHSNGNEAHARYAFSGAGVMVMRVTHVLYHTDKQGDGPSDYIHEFSEWTHGPSPVLVVDTDGKHWLVGGSYSVPPEGITD